MSDRPLTAKQQAFIAAYVGEAMGNATQAARLAGYAGTDKVLCEVGRQNLEVPGIIQALSRFRQEVSRLNAETVKRQIADAAEVQAFLSDVMRGDIQETLVTVNKHGEFVENTAQPRVRDRTHAALGLAKVCGYDQPKNEPPTAAAPPSAELQAALIEFAKARTDEETWQAFLRYREEKGV